MPGKNNIPNILFSTTRMWNCGDDFILFGLRRLLDEVIDRYNPVVYNRNPDLHLPRVLHDKEISIKTAQPGINAKVNPYGLVRNTVRQYDNSWRHDDLSVIDYCIFAGTPEWFGIMVDPLVNQLNKTDIPVAYIAIGAFDRSRDLTLDKLPQADVTLLKRAGLVTVRDSFCQKILAPLDPVRLPCTALFSAPHEKVRRPGQKLRIALSTQGISPRNGQRLDQGTYDLTVNLYRRLAKYYDCTLVCHFIDELVELREPLGDHLPFVFSYDARDYIDIYDNFDLTVTTRVHGAGLCASLGIPAVVLSHTSRSETATGFLAELFASDSVTADELEDHIASFPVESKSTEILAYKQSVKEQYIPLLEYFIRGV